MSRQSVVSTLLFAAVSALAPSFALADEASKCVQTALNSLGYDVGTVDGQIGNGTKKAFAKYLKDSKAPAFDFNPTTYGPWCLYLARTAQVDDATRVYSSKLGSAATVVVSAVVPIESVQSIQFHAPENRFLTGAQEFTQSTIDNRAAISATFPYEAVKDATRICAAFNPEWAVTDAKGELYPASCDTVVIEFWTISGPHMTYNVVKR
jgi:hypothetical protein